MAAMSAEAQPLDEAAELRALFEQGDPTALAQPLLALLFLTEIGQPWCDHGLTIFFRRLLKAHALGLYLKASFSLPQWEGPVAEWAFSLTNVCTVESVRVGRALHAHRHTRGAWETVAAAAKAAEVSSWIAGLRLVHRLEVAWPEHRRRPDRTELTALERLLGVTPPARQMWLREAAPP